MSGVGLLGRHKNHGSTEPSLTKYQHMSQRCEGDDEDDGERDEGQNIACSTSEGSYFPGDQSTTWRAQDIVLTRSPLLS